MCACHSIQLVLGSSLLSLVVLKRASLSLVLELLGRMGADEGRHTLMMPSYFQPKAEERSPRRMYFLSGLRPIAGAEKHIPKTKAGKSLGNNHALDLIVGSGNALVNLRDGGGGSDVPQDEREQYHRGGSCGESYHGWHGRRSWKEHGSGRSAWRGWCSCAFS